MARDWSLSRFVRLYVVESADEAAWDWQARCVWPLLIKAADRAGVIETSKGAKGLAAHIRMPLDVVAPALEELLADGCLVATPRGYLLRNYHEAQTAKMPGSQRQAEYKARERAKAALGDAGCNGANAEVTRGDAEVTPGNTEVTPSRAEPSRAEEREADFAASPPALRLVLSEPNQKADLPADLWDWQERLRAEVVPGSRRLPLTADRRKRIGSLLKAGYSADDLRACLDAYAAECRTNPDVRRWFNGETNWRPDNVATQLGRIGERGTASARRPQEYIP